MIKLGRAICFAIAFFTAISFALPQGSDVVSGNVSIDQAENVLTITQSTNQAIINWQQFNIGQNETTQFIVPNSNSATLNRVTGVDASVILGTLRSNGQLWLINPNGIMFGPNAQVNVASLVASTMSIQDADFQKGEYQFQSDIQNQAKIINQGNITAANNGFIALLAPQIENTGIIAANLGSVALGAGNRAALTLSGNQLLSFSVDQGTAANFYDTEGNHIAPLSNSGEIRADGGTVLLTAANINQVLNQSINTSGIVEANTVTEHNGKIIFSGAGDTMVTGDAQINAKGINSGETGGTVTIEGNRVALTDNASIDTSGPAGGGKVMIGGDYHGDNPEVTNASATYVSPNATINANATQNGNGGGVVIWADNNTKFYGKISSQGGPEGGNGGYVETSGKQNLDVAGAMVNTLAPNGNNGEWLLDPYDVTISDATTANESFSANAFTPSATGAVVNYIDIQNNLALGNVTVTTGASGAEAGNILVDTTATISYSGTNSLSLTAAGTITINGTITLSNANSALNLTSNGLISQGGSSLINVAGMTTLAAGAANDITLTNASNNFATLLISSGNNVSIRDTNGLAPSNMNITNNFTLQAAGGIFQVTGSAMVIGGITTVTTGSANNVNLNMVNNDFNTLSVFGQGIAIIDKNSIILGNMTSHNATYFNVTSNGSITQAVGSAITSGGSLTAMTAGAANNIILSNANNSFAGSTVRIVSGKDVSLTAKSGIEFGGAASAISGALTVDTSGIGGGAIIQSTNLTVSGLTTLIAGAANNITLNNTSNDFGQVTVTSGNAVTIFDTNALTMNAFTTAGAVTITSGINSSGSLTQAGALSGGSGNIVLSSANGGVIQTTGSISTSGTVNVTASNGTINLGGANNFSGALTLTNSVAATPIALTLYNSGYVATAPVSITGIAYNNSVSTGGTQLVSSATLTFPALTAGIDSSFLLTNLLTSGNISNAATYDLSLTASAYNTPISIGSALSMRNLTIISGNNINADITLNNNLNAFSGALTLSGHNITLANTGSLNLSNITTNNNGFLTLSNAGDVTIDNITTTGNFGVTANGNITLNGTINIGAASLNLNAANGSVTQALGAGIIGSGTLSVTASSGTIDLKGTSNNFTGALGLTNAAVSTPMTLNIYNAGYTTTVPVTLTLNGQKLAGATLSFPALTTGIDSSSLLTTLTTSANINSAATYNLSLLAGAYTSALTYSGSAWAFNNLNLATAGAITLSNASNALSGTVSLSGTDLSLTNSTALTLGNTTASGSLNITNVGAIIQLASTALTVGTTTTLAAGTANNITLANSGNDFTGAVSVSTANSVSLTDINALTLGAITTSSLTTTTGLTVSAGGALSLAGAINSGAANISLASTTGGISESTGVITSSGTTTLAAGSANNITLSGNNNLGHVGITSANNASLTLVGGTTIDAVTLAGNLTVNTNGTINTGGALTIAGTTTINAAAGNTISLNNAGNSFTGVFSVPGTVASITLRSGSTPLILGNIVTSGAFSLTSAGAITQGVGNVLTIAGTTTIAAGTGNNVTLTNANNFSTLAITSANNIGITDINSIILGTSTVTGTLGVTLTGTGNITQSGVLTVTGVTTLAAGSGNDITLNNASNNFNSVGITSGNNVTLVDANALGLNASTITGTLTATAGGALTQNGAMTVGSTTALTGTSITNNAVLNQTAGNVSLTATNGAITQGASGSIVMASSSRLILSASGTGNDITLTNITNDFDGVNAISNGRNISLTDANNFTLIGDITASGNIALRVNASGTSVNQFGLNLDTLLNANSGAGDITLTNSATNLNYANFGISYGAALVGANITLLSESGAISNGGTGWITSSGTTTVTANDGSNTTGNDILLGAGATDNNFNNLLIVNGHNLDVTDLDGLNLTGVTNATGYVNVLANSTNTNTGILTVSGNIGAGSNVVSLTNASTAIGAANAINLTGGTLTAGTLNILSSSGAINQTSGVINASGITTIIAEGAGTNNSISLNNASNNFNRIIVNDTIAGTAGDVTLSDVNALELGGVKSNALTVTTSGALTQQTGTAITSTGAANFAAGSLNDITLNNANNFTSVGITSGNNVSITDVNILTLAASTISGTLGVNTTGDLTQSGILTVAGATTLAVGAANNITLNSANNFSSISVASGNNVSITDANSLTLDASTVSGTLGVNTTGAITQSGVLTVTGATTLAAGSLNDIALNSANDFSSIGITSGNNVSITDANILTLAASTISGTFGVNTAGAITQSGALTVSGATALAAGTGNNITLTTGTNNFIGAVNVTSANTVSITDVNALTLGAITTSSLTATTGLTANAGGLLSLTGAINSGAANISLTSTTGGISATGGTITASGTTTLAAGVANDISLNGANDFGTLAITSGNSVSVSDANILTLAASTISGTFGVNTAGAITQSGALTVTGATTLAAGTGNNIILTTGTNNFIGAVNVTSANTVSITDVNALTLGAITTSSLTTTTGLTASASGLLSLTGAINSGAANISLTSTTGGISATGGTITASGTTTLTAGAVNDISLSGANDFGTLAIISGKNVSITDANSLILAASTISGTLGVNTTGAITQTGALTVTGVTTLAAGSLNDITLNSGNNFSTLGITSGNNVNLTNSNAIIVGASTVSGTLTMTTGGDITQSGGLTVTGLTTLTVNVGNITLNTFNNDFDTVVVTKSGTVTLGDINGITLGGIGTSSAVGTVSVTANSIDTNTGALVVNNTLITNSATVSLINASTAIAVGSDAITLSAGTITSSGLTLSIKSGAITQSGGSIVTGGVTTLVNGGAGLIGLISLNQSTNDFSQVTGSGALSGVTLVDASGISLVALNLSAANGTLNVTANGALSVDGAVATGSGAVNLSTTSLGITQGGSGSITTSGITTLNATGVTGKNISLNRAANDFGTVIVTSGNALTLVDSNSISLGALNLTGFLNVTASGAIAINGLITATSITLTSNASGGISDVGGGSIVTNSNTTLIASGLMNDISLTSVNNNFATVAVTQGGAVILNDLNGIVLGTSNISGSLQVSAAGNITQSGALAVTGATTLATGTGNNITLTNGANNFIGAVNVTSANAVSLTDVNALTLGAITTSSLTATTGLTVSAGGLLSLTGAINSGAANISLTSTTGGISAAGGTISTSGTTTLAAGAVNDISLGGANNFGTLAITSGNNVSITDANILTLAASTISGTFGINTAGAITQSGALTVTGATTLAAGTGNNIILTTGANNFIGAVNVTSANTVSITDINALTLGAITTSSLTATTGLTASASGLLSLTGAINSGAANISLTSSTGGISESGSGAITASGTTTLVAGAANDISLGGANNFGTVVITSGNNVSLTDSNAFILGASTVSNNLAISATSGNLTQAGALTVAGTTSLTLGTTIATLTNAANSLVGAVSITGANSNVSIVNNRALGLGTITASYLTLDTSAANGNITQSGTVTVSLNTILNTGIGSINLNNTGNNFNTVAITNSGALTLKDVNAISVSGAAAGTVDITANATDAATGALSITGFNAGSNAVTLTNLSTTISYFNNSAVSIATGTLITGDLTINTSSSTVSAVNFQGSINASGATTITATGATNDINLTNSANNFTGALSINARNIQIASAGALNLGATTASGTFSADTSLANASAGAAITQSAALNITGDTTLNSSSASIALDNVSNNFSTVTVSNSGQLTLKDINALTLGVITSSGAVAITANTTVSNTGTLNLTGNLNAGSNTVSLTNSSTGFGAGGSAITLSSGTLTAGALNIAASSGTIAETGGVIVSSGLTTVTGVGVGGNTVNFANAANNFNTFKAITVGDLNVVDTNNLAIDTITSSGNITLLAQNGTLTINNGGAIPIQVSANNKTLTIAASHLANNYTGTTPISEGIGGRWITYLSNLTGNTFGVDGTHALTSGNQAVWNTTYTGSSAGIPSGNRYVFAVQPTLIVTAGSNPVDLSGTKVYGTTNSYSSSAISLDPAANNVSYSGFVDASSYQDVFTQDTYSNIGLANTIASTGSVATATVLGGPYAINSSFTNTNNYNTSGTLNLGDLTVTAASLTISSLTASNKVYDATTGAVITGTATLVGTQYNGDTVSLAGGPVTSGSFNNKNVGTGKLVTADLSGLSLTGSGASNYTISGVTTPLTANITAANLTISGIAASNKVYDASTAATLTNAGSLSGVLGSDTVSLDVSSVTATFADKNVGTGKTVTASDYALTGADAGNYIINSGANTGTTTANITAANLTIAGIIASNKVYDTTTGAILTNTGSLSGVLGSDTVSLDATSVTAAFADKNVGTGKTVTASDYALTGADAGNYIINSGANTGTTTANITAANLTIAGIIASNRVYNAGTDATLTNTGSLSGVLGSDTVSLDVSAVTAAFA
ncbi:MAG: YDG domain-containing protein, partial [Gammaproteobacteria bacterium]|nr:YDG domain-containing protein [Gammaproteobacteria bacterium]